MKTVLFINCPALICWKQVRYVPEPFQANELCELVHRETINGWFAYGHTPNLRRHYGIDDFLS